MTENLEELQVKLQKSKEQLKRVKQLLSTNPYSDNLLALKKDLEEVITLTEKVVRTKTVKTYDPVKDNQLKQQQQQQQQQQQLQQQHQQPSYGVVNGGQSEIMGDNSMLSSGGMHDSSRYHNDEDEEDENDYHGDERDEGVDNQMAMDANSMNNGMDGTSNVTNAGNDAKPIPREWGIEKSHYEVGERCQVKYEANRRWYMAVVIEVISDAMKEELILNNSNNNNSSNASKLSKYQWYRVRFLDNGQEYNTCTKFMRTYVPHLVSQIHVGSRVKAIWDEDGLFHRAVVEEILSDGQYSIKFDKYNTKEVVPLQDIQLCGSAKGNAAGSNKYGSFRIEKDKKGFLKVDEKASIPQALWKKKEEGESTMDRKKRHKKIKSIKRKHDQLKDEVDRKNKQHSWQRFLNKGIKKSQKKLHGSLIRPTESIFQSPMDNEARVGIGRSGPKMTSFEERTHFHHLKKDPKEYPHMSNSTPTGIPTTPTTATTTTGVAALTNPSAQLLQMQNTIPMASVGINNFNVGINMAQQWQSPLPTIIPSGNINDPHNSYFRQ